jgi:hypothetical protein
MSTNGGRNLDEAADALAAEMAEAVEAARMGGRVLFGEQTLSLMRDLAVKYGEGLPHPAKRLIFDAELVLLTAAVKALALAEVES